MAECGAGCGAHAGSGEYALQLSDGSRVVADAVVLATPAWASGDLLRPVAPLAAADLSSIEYVTTATASVAFRAEQVGHDLKGFGFVVPRSEDRPGDGDHLELQQVRRARARRPRAAAQLPRARRPRGRGPAGRRRDGRGRPLRAPRHHGHQRGARVRRDLPLAARHAAVPRRPRRAGRAHRGRRRRACPASSSPAAPTTASASATACARARPRPNVLSSTSAASPRTRSRRSRRTSPPPTASKTSAALAARAAGRRAAPRAGPTVTGMCSRSDSHRRRTRRTYSVHLRVRPDVPVRIAQWPWTAAASRVQRKGFPALVGYTYAERSCRRGRPDAEEAMS